jgi:serine/threonine-protein kinase
MDLTGRSFGHIRVDRMLGQGGMGDVYEGFDVRLARRVALKVLNSDGLLDDEARTRLVREARTLSKLDHPNICRIYDFIDDRDADVLVLELIDGRTLHEAMRDGNSTAEKLRIARDVASVLVAAHRAGIIHRDLKPENIMLTKSGEVKVLDFGLARWLKRKSGKSYPAVSPERLHVDPQATAVRPVEIADANATAVGITVGTPLFMSPEQARGEPLTTASDMYSFGLLLQALFTGRDPYPHDLTAREVMIRASRGESLAVNGVRRDVAALIKSLKAFAPSDRPTARDALHRLERIIERPKRVAQRIAAAAVLAFLIFAGWKYTTDLRRERTAAQKAEAEAKRRRAQADSLIGFMLGDLKARLEPVGRLDVLDAVAERSLRYIASLDTEVMTPQEIARNSKALNQLGEVRVSQGNLAAALDVFNKSLLLAQAAQRRAPSDPELLLGVGTAHYWVGNARRLKGDLPAALTHMSEYRRVTEELAQKYPSNDEYQVERAYGHSTVGTILEAQGNLPGALEEYRVVLAIKSARLAGNPADAKRQADVAVTLNKAGFVLERLGQLAAARQHFEREFAIYESLANADPKNVRWKDRLANSYDYVGGILEDLGDGAALRCRESQVAAYRNLVAHDPANAEWRRNLAISMNKHANLLRANGDVGKALAEYAEAEAALEDLMVRDRARSSWRTDLALVDRGYARALLAHRQVAAAREKAKAAVDVYAEVFKTRQSVRSHLAEAFVTSGEVAAAAGDRASAEAAWRSAVELLQPTAASTSDPRLIAVVTRALILLGRNVDAQPLIARIQEVGYREGDFERLLQHRN